MEKDKVRIIIQKEPYVTPNGEQIDNPLNSTPSHTFVRLTEMEDIKKPNIFKDRSYNGVGVYRQDLNKIEADIEKRNQEKTKPFEKESIIIFEK